MELNQDFYTITDFSFQWKINFNPDPNKKAAGVVLSHKDKRWHPPLYFNGSAVVSLPREKHRGLVLDEKPSFDHHLSEKIVI